MDWIALIFSGVALVLAIILKETFAPTLLQKKAAQLRKETDDPRWWSRYDQKATLFQILKLNLSRPFVMAVTEPIWYVTILSSEEEKRLTRSASSGTSTSPSSTAFYISASSPTRSSSKTSEAGPSVYLALHS